VRTLRSIAVAAGIAAVTVALAGGSPAGAKGPRSATIDGPGLDAPIVSQAGVVSKLPDLAGVYGPLWDDSMVLLLDEPPTDALGPGYEITWDLGEYFDEAGQSTGTPALVRQTVYPYAAGSPLVHTEAGQPFYAEETTGGWFIADPSLRDLLIDMGVPARREVEEVTASAASPASAAGGSGRGWVLPTVLAAVALATVALATAGLVRRRTTAPTAEPTADAV